MSLPPSDLHPGFGEGTALGLGALPDEIIATLLAQKAALREIIASLTVRVADLERRLGLNSSNRGKRHPATD